MIFPMRHLLLAFVFATLAIAPAATSAAETKEASSNRRSFEPYVIVLALDPGVRLDVMVGKTAEAVEKLPCPLPRDAKIKIEGPEDAKAVLSLPRGRKAFGPTENHLTALELNQSIQASGARDSVYPAMKHFFLGGVSRAGGDEAALVYPTENVFVRAEAWRMVFPPDWPRDADTTLVIATAGGAEIARAVLRVPASGVLEAPAAWAQSLAGHPGASLKLAATASERSAATAFTLLAPEAVVALDQRLAAADAEPDPVLRRISRAFAYEQARLPLESILALAEALRLDQPARYPALREVVASAAARHGLAPLLAP